MSADHPRDLLPDYALGLLEPEETAAVEAHLAGCAACQAEAWSLAEPLVAMTEALPTENPPERTWRALAAAYTQVAPTQISGQPSGRTAEPSPEPPGQRPAREVPAVKVPARPASYLWPLVASLSFVVALGSLLWGVSNYNALQRVQADEHLLSRYLAQPDVQKVVLENVLGSGRTEPVGSALLSAGRPAQEVLFVLGENAPAGHTYQAWGHTGSDWDPAGGETLESLLTTRSDVFEVEAGGFASLYLSLEPAGGSPQPTNPLSKVSLLDPAASAPLEITAPEDGATVSASSFIVSGVVDPSVERLRYTLNGGAPTRTASANNRFSFTVAGLEAGDNTVEVRGTTEDGETVSVSVRVAYTP